MGAIATSSKVPGESVWDESRPPVRSVMDTTISSQVENYFLFSFKYILGKIIQLSFIKFGMYISLLQ